MMVMEISIIEKKVHTYFSNGDRTQTPPPQEINNKPPPPQLRSSAQQKIPARTTDESTKK